MALQAQWNYNAEDPTDFTSPEIYNPASVSLSSYPTIFSSYWSGTPPTLSRSTFFSSGSYSYKVQWNTGSIAPQLYVSVDCFSDTSTINMVADVYVPSGSPSVVFNLGDGQVYAPGTTYPFNEAPITVKDQWITVSYSWLVANTPYGAGGNEYINFEPYGVPASPGTAYVDNWKVWISTEGSGSGSSTVKWRFEAPFDTFVFPKNPSSMSDPYPIQKITAESTTAGKPHLWVGTGTPVEWRVEGYTDSEYVLARFEDFYARKQRFDVVDHLSRRMTVSFENLDLRPRRVPGIPYGTDYSLTFLVLDGPQ